jgi:hypothetical protein
MTSNRTPNLLAAAALTTNSPLLSHAGIESDLGPPGPLIHPPVAAATAVLATPPPPLGGLFFW